ncbi:hypothetical protein BSCH_01111 [Candidatus Paraburkholderia schumanniana]|nr:hypothetical protein BSCH_01111 [Candidatus Paraburkholderia schumannianae]
MSNKQVEVTRGAGKDLALEGLRGIAALGVVLSHCFLTFFPYLQTGELGDRHGAWEAWLLNTPLWAFYNGTFDVTVFFVMSGYVLTRKFFSRHDYRSLQGGAAKRYIRLGVPVAASVMVGFVMMKLPLFPAKSTNLHEFIRNAYVFQPSPATALKDAVYGSLLFGHAQYNYILWTIGVEFLGSLLLFAFLALFGHSRLRGWIALLISVAWIIVDPANGVLFALFFVAAFMHVWKMPRSTWAVAGCILIGLWLYLGSYHWYAHSFTWIVRGANALIRMGVVIECEWPIFIPAIGSVFLVAAALGRNHLTDVLSSRAAVWLGDKSFSLYLTHTFVLSSLGVYSYIWTTAVPYQTRAWISIAVTIVVSLIVSAVFARPSMRPQSSGLRGSPCSFGMHRPSHRLPRLIARLIETNLRNQAQLQHLPPAAEAASFANARHRAERRWICRK